MEITNELIDHIAHLSRLEFEGDKKDEIRMSLTKMIGFVDKLNEIDTENVEPLIFMSEAINVLREDVIKKEVTQEEGLKNAANHDSDYFKIAKVLKK